MSQKLRVIQSNSNGQVEKIGDFCFSGLKSFSDKNPSEVKQTLFIYKEDKMKLASVFDSTFTGDITEDGKFVFQVITPPMTVNLTDTEFSEVHLMSSSDLKHSVVEFIQSEVIR